MTYHPLSIYSVKSADEIQTLCYARDFKNPEREYLFTGGHSPMIVQLSDTHPMYAFELGATRLRQMMVVEDIEFEFDPGHSSLWEFEQLAGSLIMSETANGLAVVRQGHHSQAEIIDVFFNDETPDEAIPSEKLRFFKQWRIIRRHHDKPITLFEFEAVEKFRR